MNVGISTNIEAKLRSTVDSNPDAGEKIKILSVNFTGMQYDFERARATGSRIRGLTTQNFGYNVKSDLLPGVDVNVDYSLFEGSTQSDTARFKPYRERIAATMSFSDKNNPFAVLTRIFGKAAPTTPGADRTRPAPDDKYAREIASQPVAGRGARTAAYLPSISEGWQASFNFTSQRQRPPGRRSSRTSAGSRGGCGRTARTPFRRDRTARKWSATRRRRRTSAWIGAPTCRPCARSGSRTRRRRRSRA
jgi:hypothetical protein